MARRWYPLALGSTDDCTIDLHGERLEWLEPSDQASFGPLLIMKMSEPGVGRAQPVRLSFSLASALLACALGITG